MACRSAACAALLAVLVPASAGADEVVIPLPPDISVETLRVDYMCGTRELPVTYINAGSVSLAVLEVDGEFLVASLTLAASGARYVANQYVWWSKGKDADLYDLTRGEDAAPLLACTGSAP